MSAVDLPPEAEAKLGEAAGSRGVTLPADLRSAMLDHIDDLEDAAEAERALDDIGAGRSGTTPLAEVERELGLGDRDR